MLRVQTKIEKKENISTLIMATKFAWHPVYNTSDHMDLVELSHGWHYIKLTKLQAWFTF